MICCHTQSGCIITNIKVKIYFTLTELSATEIVTWNCHVNDSDQGRYDIILGRDIFTALGSNLKFCDHVIEAYGGPFKGYMTPMVDLCMYNLKF